MRESETTLRPLRSVALLWRRCLSEATGVCVSEAAGAWSHWPACAVGWDWVEALTRHDSTASSVLKCGAEPRRVAPAAAAVASPCIGTTASSAMLDVRSDQRPKLDVRSKARGERSLTGVARKDAGVHSRVTRSTRAGSSL